MVLNFLKKSISGVKNKLMDYGSSIYNKVVGSLSIARKYIEPKINKVETKLSDVASYMHRTINKGVGTIYDRIKGGLSKGKTIVSDARNKIINTGKSIVDTIGVISSNEKSEMKKIYQKIKDDLFNIYDRGKEGVITTGDKIKEMITDFGDGDGNNENDNNILSGIDPTLMLLAVGVGIFTFFVIK